MPQPRQNQPLPKKKVPTASTLFWRRLRGGEGLFEAGLPPRYLANLLFMAVCGLLYIANTHYSERLTRRISKIESEVSDLRVDYHTLQADYVLRSRQSEVADQVRSLGLEESLAPPQKIVLPRHEP